MSQAMPAVAISTKASADSPHCGRSVPFRLGVRLRDDQSGRTRLRKPLGYDRSRDIRIAGASHCQICELQRHVDLANRTMLISNLWLRHMDATIRLSVLVERAMSEISIFG